jgi:hypothetical protein
MPSGLSGTGMGAGVGVGVALPPPPYAPPKVTLNTALGRILPRIRSEISNAAITGIFVISFLAKVNTIPRSSRKPESMTTISSTTILIP